MNALKKDLFPWRITRIFANLMDYIHKYLIVRNDTVQSLAESNFHPISEQNINTTIEDITSSSVRETDWDNDFSDQESLISSVPEIDWGEDWDELPSGQVENNKTADNTIDLYEYRTEMNLLERTLKRPKPKIYWERACKRCTFKFNGEFFSCGKESLSRFHDSFEPLFGPLFNYVKWDKLTPKPTIMVREGDKISRYVREEFETRTTLCHVRERTEALPSYVFRREMTSSHQEESYIQITFRRTSWNEESYYMDMPTLTEETKEGTFVATLPGLVDQILDPQFTNTNTSISTFVGNSWKSYDYITIFFERRAIYLENQRKEFLLENTPYDIGSIVMIILEYIDRYGYWLWKRQLEDMVGQSSMPRTIKP